MKFENSIQKDSDKEKKIESLEEKTVHDKIKEEFLNDKITVEEFREKIIKLDQTGTHTEEALDNIKLLEDDEVRDKIFSFGNNDYEKAYYRLLSISYFHHGQGTVDIEAFKEAYYYAKKDSDVLWRKGWINYTEGTLAYLDNNIDKLRKNTENATEKRGDNKDVLLRLLASLERGHNPKEFYFRAYAGLLEYKFKENENKE